MSKLLVVFGATGKQGGSVVDYVLQDPVLSRQYKVCAVTRNPTQTAAHSLRKKGVEIRQGDADDESSLTAALQGAHTVFAITASIYDDRLKAREIAQGKAIANVAVATGAEYLIFSTLPHITKISKGQFTNVQMFDAKAEVEEYIRTLPIKSAFYAPGYFMQNFSRSMAPRANSDGTYTISNIISPETQIPMIDPATDSGKFVCAILEDPEKFVGETVFGVTKLISYPEAAEIISRVSGKTVRYAQVPKNVFRELLYPSTDMLVDMFLYLEAFGYYGPGSKELVQQAVEHARGKLTTFEEYLQGPNQKH